MSKHILFNEQGALEARYDSDIHGSAIPSGAIEVGDDLFFQTIDEQDGVWSLVDGEIVKQPLPDPEPYIPSVVSMRQVRLALLGAGHLAQVNAAVDAMEGDQGEASRIEWEYATEVRRDSPLVASMAGALGLADEDLDQLFTVAATL